MKIRVFAACVLLGSFCIDAQAQVQMNPPDDFMTRDDSTTQSETNHAMTANGILAAWNDASQLATGGTLGVTSQVAWGYSQDSGASFTGGSFFTSDKDHVIWGDPAIVADSSGFFYLAAIARKKDPMDKQRDLAVARSTGTTAPFSFGEPVILKPIRPGGMLDKELMAFDRARDRIYIVAIDLNLGVVMARTKSLSPRLEFSDWQVLSSNLFARDSMPAMGPDGSLYVIWTDTKTKQIKMVKSKDGGETFSAVTLIAPFLDLSSLSSPYGFLGVTSFAQIAVDSTAAGSPTCGNVYAVFPADPDVKNAKDKSDIFFTRSTDGGVTWAAPRSITSGLAATLGQDPTINDNWMPSIAVSPVNGHIYVTFYDRRFDSDDTVTHVFRALSTDGGLTWASTPISAAFIPIVGFPQAGRSNSYWGEYNWTTADVNGVHFTWGDSHHSAPSGRPDLDVYYHTIPNLSGPDLFIQPWGAVTGIGPAWRSPDVFVVDRRGHEVDPHIGKINFLRARVRNLGSAAARGAVVRFRYAPWFAGLNDLLFKDLGTVRLDFSAASGRTDTRFATVLWNLTNAHDTNGGLWPAEIGKFDHLCVKVSIELPGDINLSNNAAQSNFADVRKAGLSVRLHRSGAPGDLRGIGPVTSRYWEVKTPTKPPDVLSTPGFQLPPPPPRVIPEGVRFRRTYPANYEETFRAAVTSFADRLESPAIANSERGLINSHGQRLTAEEIRSLVVPADMQQVTGDGYAIVSLYFQPLGEGRTEVGAAALIAVDDPEESPLGRVLTSNGTLESSYLDAMTARIDVEAFGAGIRRPRL